MISSNQELQNLINSPVRKINARVELYRGSTLVDTFNTNDKLVEVSIERVGDNSKFFGYGICQKATVKIIDKEGTLNITTDESMKIYFTTGSFGVKNNPSFNVTQCRRDENTNQLSVFGYDSLYKASQKQIKEISLPTAYTVMDLLKIVANSLGFVDVITQGLEPAESCFDTYYPKGANLSGEETLRDILDKIAEITQTIYYVSPPSDGIIFKRLKKDGTADLTISKNEYFTLTSGDNRRLSKIASITELGDNVEASIPEAGTTQYIRENPFWDLRDDINVLLDNAIAVIGGFTSNQFECSWRGNFALEIGDKISLEAKDGTMKQSYVVDDVLTYNGTLTEITRWKYENTDAETASNPTSIGETIKNTYARVDKANQKIELAVKDMDGRYNKITQTLDGVVYDNGSGTTIINGDNITTGTISAARLNLTGEIVWNDLSQGVKNTINSAGGDTNPDYIQDTYIDAVEIRSPTITGNDIQAKGAFKVMNGIATQGYMGKGYGIDANNDTTNGVVLSAGDPALLNYDTSPYLIVTDAGVRMQAGQYSLFVTAGGAYVATGNSSQKITGGGGGGTLTIKATWGV